MNSHSKTAVQGGRKQRGTGCWCPPTFHRPLQFVYSYIVCVQVFGDSKCFTILHFTCTIKCKIHVLTTKSMIIHAFTLGSHDMVQKKLNSFFDTREASTSEPLSQNLQVFEFKGKRFEIMVSGLPTLLILRVPSWPPVFTTMYIPLLTSFFANSY